MDTTEGTEGALDCHFRDLGIGIEAGDPGFLHECRKLCDEYNVEARQFVEMWTAYTLETNSTMHELKLSKLRDMERAVLKPLEKRQNLEELSRQNKVNAKGSNLTEKITTIDYDDDILGMYGYKALKPTETQSPQTQGTKRAGSPLSPDTENHELESLDDIAAEFGDVADISISAEFGSNVLRKFGSDVADWRSKKPWRVLVSKTNDPHVPPGALYMFELPSKISGVFQKVCREFGASLCAAWNKKTGAKDQMVRANPTTQSQTSFRTWGRILPIKQDAEKAGYFVELEGCKAQPESSAIHLDLSSLTSYSLFPGQIIAVEGKNPTGRKLIVEHLYDSGCPPPPKPPLIQENLHIVVAAGPFTAPNSMDHQPLFQLVDLVVTNEPHVLILVGPFLPHDNPEIANSTHHYTYQEMFEQLVEKIMRLLEGKCTQVVLIPSCQDVHHDSVYPTPEYFVPKTMQSPKLHLMPDPCSLDLEGLVIGATSADIIRHLSSQEINKKMSGEERPARLASHILSQACFYPLYPASAEINLDAGLWEKYAFMYTKPHILVLPSDMRCFCKWTEDCFVVNPHRLKKQTYARMIVKPCGDRPWTKDRVVCEILKL